MRNILKDENKRKIIRTVTPIIVALVCACWALFVFFTERNATKSTPPDSLGIHIINNIELKDFSNKIEKHGISEADIFLESLNIGKVPKEKLSSTLSDIYGNIAVLDSLFSNKTDHDKNVSILREKAYEEFKKGNFKKSEELLNNASQIDITMVEPARKISEKRMISAASSKHENGIIKLIQLKYQDAAQYFKEASELVPANNQKLKTTYLEKWAIASLMTGDVSIIEKIISDKEHSVTDKEKENYSSSETMLLRGLLNIAQGNYLESEYNFLKYIDISSREKRQYLPWVFFLTGVSCQLQNKTERAKQFYLNTLNMIKEKDSDKTLEIITKFKLNKIYQTEKSFEESEIISIKWDEFYNNISRRNLLWVIENILFESRNLFDDIFSSSDLPMLPMPVIDRSFLLDTINIICERVFEEDNPILIHYYVYTGDKSFGVQNYTKAKEYYKKSLNLYNLHPATRYNPRAYLHLKLSQSNRYSGEPHSAQLNISKLTKALDSLDPKENYDLQTHIYNEIAWNYFDISHFTKAEEYLNLWASRYDKNFKSGSLNNNTKASTDRVFGTLHYALGRYKQSEQLLLQALGKFENNPSQNGSLSNAHCLRKLAWIYYELREFPKAIQYFEKAIKLYDKIHGVDNSNALFCQNGIGWCHYYLSNYSKSLEKFTTTLKMFQGKYGDNNSNTSHSLYNLAFVELYIGKLPIVKKYFSKSLAIREKLSGEQSLSKAKILIGLGWYHYDMGNYLKAEELFKESFSLRTVYGSDHPRNINLLSGISRSLTKLGKFEESDIIVNKSLQLARSTFGNTHPRYARSLYALGSLQYARKEYDAALKTFTESYTIMEKHYGKNNTKTAQVLSMLGATFRNIGKPQKCIDLSKEALTIRIDLLGENHRYITSNLVTIAKALYDVNQFQESEEYINQALSILYNHFPDGHPDIAACYFTLSKIYSKTGQLPAAMRFINNSIDIYSSAFGEDHFKTLEAIAFKNQM